MPLNTINYSSAAAEYVVSCLHDLGKILLFLISVFVPDNIFARFKRAGKRCLWAVSEKY